MNSTELDSGWTYYGRHKHLTGKRHFLLPNTNQSLCRLHTFTVDDMRNMRIADANNLFKSQLCKKCLEILNLRNTALGK
ncbi:MAG TPA: hypothetical protein VFJ23_06785 [Candidatus Nitrosotalea sp.]|nr:hypothetical protein [Candidatus Nitrosotalea sp.]